MTLSPWQASAVSFLTANHFDFSKLFSQAIVSASPLF